MGLYCLLFHGSLFVSHHVLKRVVRANRESFFSTARCVFSFRVLRPLPPLLLPLLLPLPLLSLLLPLPTPKASGNVSPSTLENATQRRTKPKITKRLVSLSFTSAVPLLAKQANTLLIPSKHNSSRYGRFRDDKRGKIFHQLVPIQFMCTYTKCATGTTAVRQTALAHFTAVLHF